MRDWGRRWKDSSIFTQKSQIITLHECLNPANMIEFLNIQAAAKLYALDSPLNIAFPKIVDRFAQTKLFEQSRHAQGERI